MEEHAASSEEAVLLTRVLLWGGALGGWLSLILIYALAKRTSVEYLWWLITG